MERIIDLAEYRAARQARQQSLFDVVTDCSTVVTVATISSKAADRPLAQREKAHRERMLRHLAAVESGRLILSS